MKKILKGRSKGFTLIELVIVIAVLGILAGLAISRFTDMQEAAKGARVLADLRTIESAANMYAVDHGTLPPRVNGDNTSIFSKYLAAWPVAPTGIISVTGDNGKIYRYSLGKSIKGNAITYSWNGPDESQGDVGMNAATLGRWTIDNFKNNSGTEHRYITLVK